MGISDAIFFLLDVIFLLKHYLDLYVTDVALKVSQYLYCFTTSISNGVKNIFPGGGVRASAMLFFQERIFLPFFHFFAALVNFYENGKTHKHI